MFSTLTTLLSDQRLRLKHETMEDRLLIGGNRSAWTESNKKEILDSAVLKYLEKCPTMKIATACPAPPKVKWVSVSSDEEKQQTENVKTSESDKHSDEWSSDSNSSEESDESEV